MIGDWAMGPEIFVDSLTKPDGTDRYKRQSSRRIEPEATLLRLPDYAPSAPHNLDDRSTL